MALLTRFIERFKAEIAETKPLTSYIDKMEYAAAIAVKNATR